MSEKINKNPQTENEENYRELIDGLMNAKTEYDKAEELVLEMVKQGKLDFITCINNWRNALEKIDNVEKEFNTAKSELEMTEHVVREMAAQGKLDYITSIRDWREAGEKLNGLESRYFQTTNAVKIRNMSDEELAKLLCMQGWKMAEYKECLEWLSQPAEPLWSEK